MKEERFQLCRNVFDSDVQLSQRYRKSVPDQRSGRQEAPVPSVLSRYLWGISPTQSVEFPSDDLSSSPQ